MSNCQNPRLDPEVFSGRSTDKYGVVYRAVAFHRRRSEITAEPGTWLKWCSINEKGLTALWSCLLGISTITFLNDTV